MPIKVNLIKNRHTLSEAEYQRERQLYKYSIIAVVFVIVVTVAISIWQFVLTSQMNSTEQKIANYTGQLQKLTEASAKQIYLKSRLKLITAFLDDRSVARESLQKVFQIDLPGVTITSANFEEDNVLSVQATATDAGAFDNVVKYFSQDNGFFIQAVSKGVSRSDKGEYQMELLLTLPNSAT